MEFYYFKYLNQNILSYSIIFKNITVFIIPKIEKCGKCGCNMDFMDEDSNGLRYYCMVCGIETYIEVENNESKVNDINESRYINKIIT